MVPNGMFSPSRALMARSRVLLTTRPLQVGAAAFALTLMAGGAASADEFWTGEGGDQYWSTPGNWLSGTPPSPGGDESLTLGFTKVREGIPWSRNDLAGTFTLNRLVLANQTTEALSISAQSTRLRLAGTDPEIVLRGSGPVDITAPLTLDSADGRVRITGTGQGNLTLSGPITEGATRQALVIATTQRSPGTQLVNLSMSGFLAPDEKVFSGGLVLASGTAVAAGGLGAGPIYFEGGTLRLVGATQVSRPIVLRADAEIDLRNTSSSGNNVLYSSSFTSETAGTGVTFRGATPANIVGATLSAATYSGPTTIALSRDVALPTAESVAPTIFLNGTSHLTGAIQVLSGGRLHIAGAATGNGRIGDGTPVSLRGGALEFAGGTGTGVQGETVGAVDGGGYSVLTLSASSSPGTRLTATSLTRTERGTFLFRGAKLGTTMGAGVGNIVFNTAPTGLVGGGGTGANTSILPWAIGDAAGSFASGSSFVTYNSVTGIRPLNPTTEYTAITSAAATSNVRVASPALGFNADRTINSLLLDGGTVSGSGVITIASGAILQRSGGGVTNPIAFGTAEANIFTIADLELPGTLSGTGGLTKSAAGTLTLSGNNSFTGQLTVNAGTIAFPKIESLGAAESAVVIASTGAGLRYTGDVRLTFSRPIETKDGFAVLSAPAGDFSITGQISGMGGLSLSSGANATLALSGYNTYRGITRVAAGRVSISGDAALGDSGPLALAGGTLALSGSWVTSREIFLGEASSGLPTASGLIDTGEFDVVWDGVVRGILRKAGSGSLTLSQPALLQRIDALSGPLVLTKEGALPLGSLTLAKTSALRLDNSVTPNADRLLDGVVVALQGSSFSISGHGIQEVSERIGQIALGNYGGNTIALTAPGTAGVTLHLAEGFSSEGGTVVLRAAHLGGAAATSFERLVTHAPGSQSAGIIPGILADPGLTGIGTHFVMYDESADAAGVIGFRPLAEEAYTRGTVLRNPTNGGTTPLAAHFLSSSDMTATGAVNTVESLTLEGSGNLILSEGQTIALGSGRILLRDGDSSAVFSGGTLDFGAARGEIYAGRDLAISSGLAGSGGLTKSGPGVLTLNGTAGYTGGTLVNEGLLKTGAGDPLAAQSVVVAAGARLDVSAGSTAIGALKVSDLNLGSSTLTVGGAGDHSSFAGIAGSGQIILLDGRNAGITHRFVGENESFTGVVRLDSGRLLLASPNALGTNSLVIRGGSLGVESAAPVALSITLEAGLDIRGSSALNLGPGSTVSGAHDLIIRGVGGLSISGALSLAGRLRTEAAPGDDFVLTPGTIAIRDAGRLSAPAGVQISAGGKLALEYRSGDSASANSRLDDAAPLALRGSTLELASTTNTLAPTPVNSFETVGPITGTGRAIVSLHNNGASAQLTAASLARSERGTFLFNSASGTFGNAIATNAGQIRVNSLPELIGGGGTGANTSILPWASGSQAAGAPGLVTFGPNGVRVLAAGEYATSLASTAATNNVVIDFPSVTHEETRTINSLTLRGAVLGNGTLNITSGAVALATSSTAPTLLSNNLAFGEREAIFHIPAATIGGINMTGAISGSGGLTLSGATGSTLTLAGNNSFSGPLTINGGKLSFGALSHLGASTAPIALHGHGASLSFSGIDTALTLPRDVELRGGVSRLEASGEKGMLDVANRISGIGGLRIAGAGAVHLGTMNSYGGSTIIEGTAVIGSDAALGTGTGGVFFAGGTLKLAAPWTTDRHVGVQSFGTLDTNGFDAVLRGAFESTGLGGLTKMGAGTLQIYDSHPFSQSLTVAGGEVRLADAGALRSMWVHLSSSGRLVLDNSARIADRLPDSARVYANGGELRITGHASQRIAESVGVLFSSPNTASIITIGGMGQAPVSLTSPEYLESAGAVLFRGDDLGKEGGSRIIFGKAPGSIGGVIVGALADDSATGSGSSFATYDSSTDAMGRIGIRPLADGEFTTGSAIGNRANGGATSALANFRALSSATATGPVNRINSLRLSNGAGLQLTSAQTLHVGAPGLLADAGSTAVITGGTLRLEKAGFTHLIGDLALASRVLGTMTKTGPGTLKLQPGASLDGILNVLGGTLDVATTTPLRNATVSIGTAGLVQISHSAASIANLKGEGTVHIPTGSTLTVGTLAGVQTSGGGSLALTRNSTVTSSLNHAGPTFIGGASRGNLLVLNGDGEVRSTSRMILTAGSLFLDNQSRTTPRIAPVPLDMHGAHLELLAGSAPVSQSFGTLTARGTSSIRIDHRLINTASNAELSFESLVRADRGTVTFSSNRPGSGDVFRFTDIPTNALAGAGTTTKNQPILPYAMYSWGATDTFATAELGLGIRPLAEDEISSSLTSGDNVRISTATVIAAPTTVNALIASANISGDHPLGISSGQLISNNTNFARVSTPVGFGTAEANVFVTPGSYLIFSGALSGSGGLTKSGGGSMSIDGSYGITGLLTLNSGTLYFSRADGLRNVAGEINLDAGTLLYSGEEYVALSQPIRLTGSGAAIEGNVRINQPVTGPGGLRISSRVILEHPPAYTGPTAISGLFRVASENFLGTSSKLQLSDLSTLQPVAPVHFQREVEVLPGRATLEAFGNYNTHFSRLAGAGTLRKLDPEILKVEDGGAFTGVLEIEAGTLEVAGSIGGLVNVHLNGLLRGDGSFSRLTARGTIDPGGEGIGVFQTGRLEAGDATFRFTIASPTDFDQIITTELAFVSGTILSLQLSPSFDPVEYVDQFTLFRNDSALSDVFSGSFVVGGNEVRQDDTFVLSNQEWRISYTGGDGNDLVIYAVPEPSTGMLALLSTVLIGFQRNRRRSRSACAS